MQEIQSVGEYLKMFGTQLAERVQREAQPLFTPGEEWDPNLEILLRPPYPAQGDTIMSMVKTLKRQDSAVVVGEMGTGKTLIAASIPYIFHNGTRPARTLVMCPGHLVKKWKREVIQTIPNAKASILRSLGDVLKLDPSRKPSFPEYFIVSKERAKLGYAWRPAVLFSEREGFYLCPDCGQTILDKDGVPVELAFIKRNRRFCDHCNAALWQADNKKVRRFALSEYIKKHLKGFFDFFIADEVHELKGGNTAQGNSFGALASASKKTVALTGTLLGGYADDIFFVLYRLSPQTMLDEDLAYGRVSEWMARYGVLERVTRYSADDNTQSRGKKSQTYLKRKPGVSPMVFARHLLDKCAFVHLEDITSDLPPITEQVLPLDMGPELGPAYRQLEGDLVTAVRQALARGSKALLGTYLNTLLAYPDRPFDNPPIFDPQEENSLIADPPELSKECSYPKEEELLSLIQHELAHRRRVFVYCQYTNTKDVTGRLKNILQSKGIRAEILRSTVKPETREDWLKARVREGSQVIIANPKLVETGLDLLDFPNIVFFQTGYSIYTLRQASRRSWRIGQDKKVKIFYLCYQGTMQERALQLMGSKLEASLALEGIFSEEGLLAMTSGEDMTTLMAKALVDGLEVEGAEQIWRNLNRLQPQRKPFKPPMPKPPSSESNAPNPQSQDMEDRLIYVDVSTALTGKRTKSERLAIKAEEQEETLNEKEGVTVQLALFG